MRFYSSNAQSPREVAITGAGIISCLGLNCDEVRAALRAGRSGISLCPERRQLGFQSSLSGTITGFVSNSIGDRKLRKTMPDFCLWAWAAVDQALAQAGLTPAELHGDEHTGLLFGNDCSTVTAIEQVDVLRAAGETRAIGSGHIFRSLTSTITLNLGTILGLRGACWTVSGACASGAMAIGQAAELIASGRQERVICGGAQEISWQSMCSFDALGAFSKRQEAPEQASRPFDRERDGLVPSGGAAALVLESLESAEARGARAMGKVLGYATASDGHNIVVPSGDGLQRAMLAAIRQAGLDPAQIDLVLAHATSTPLGDRAEAVVLSRMFGTDRGKKGPVIAALKGLTGHEFWMAGSSQAVYGLLMAQGGFVAGNANLSRPDAEAESLRLPRQVMEFSPRYLLCNAAGFGGTNACLAIEVLA